MDLERTVLVGREAATQVPLLTVAASWAFRQPLGFFWTIPGTIIVGPALHSLTWPEVIGAYVLTALLVLGIGLTGMVDRVMSLLPMRVVMAMVAGVFLSFGIDLVAAVESDVMIAAPMVLVFLLATAFPSVGRFVPPILGALVVGVLVVLRRAPSTAGPRRDPGWPLLCSLRRCFLVGGDRARRTPGPHGLGRAERTGDGGAPRGRPPPADEPGHRRVWRGVPARGRRRGDLDLPDRPDQRAADRVGRAAAALRLGAGVRLDGDRRRAARPGFVRLLLAMPVAFVAALGGLAMLRALEGAFRTAFSGTHVTAALVRGAQG